MKKDFLNNAFQSIVKKVSVRIASDSSFINSDLFIDHLQPTIDNSLLFVLDNHSSHISLTAANFCHDNGVHVIT